MAWSNVCKPKSNGGLGIRDLLTWNKAACFKYVWEIHSKKDSLWLKWIQHIYLKGENIWEHNALIHSSWQWKELMKVKEQVKASFRNQVVNFYSISKGYNLFLGQQERCQWSGQIWNRWNVPKHSFIMWLAWHNRLATRSRLKKFLDIADEKCVFCSQQEEEIEHLFFTCHWTGDCLNCVKMWLNWSCNGESITGIIRRIHRCKMSKFRKKVLLTTLDALVYEIWRLRNRFCYTQKYPCDDVAYMTDTWR